MTGYEPMVGPADLDELFGPVQSTRAAPELPLGGTVTVGKTGAGQDRPAGGRPQPRSGTVSPRHGGKGGRPRRPGRGTAPVREIFRVVLAVAAGAVLAVALVRDAASDPRPAPPAPDCGAQVAVWRGDDPAGFVCDPGRRP